MPTYKHEVPLRMVRSNPHLAVEILRDVCGIAVPAHDEVAQASENVSTVHPAELICDGAVVAKQDGESVFGVVVESQLRDDPAKNYSWPAYLTTFRHHNKCDTELLVICPDRATAQQLAEPIVLNPSGAVVYPLTVAPADLPPVTSLDEARQRPELTVLTAPVNADGPRCEEVVHAYCEALEVLDRADGVLYHDYAKSLFSDAARRLMEEIVKIEGYQWQSDFAIEHQSIGRAEGRAEGEALGEAKALLLVLRGRKVCVSDQARERIMGCTDLDKLERWLERAATVDTVDELFA
jgi:hypothetical protein